MTLFTKPLPLHFGDACATLANLRVSAPPPSNAADIATAFAFINAAFVRYCRDRAAYLRANPGAPGAAEAESLAAVTRLEPRYVPAVFNYVVCRAFIDRPILCLLLAQAWARQAGWAERAGSGVEGEGVEEGEGGGGEEAEALTAFQACCEWAGAVAVPGMG